MNNSKDGVNVRLDQFENRGFSRGSSRATEVCWTVISGTLVESWLPGSSWRRQLLRAFGARIGTGVVIKPRVRIKFPWRLTVGDYSWIGEAVWIDNLATVTIAEHSCVSQGAYLCTGSHDWSDRTFKLVTKPIEIGKGCWIGACARIAPGCVMEDGAVVAMHALGTGRLKESTILSADGKTRRRELK